MADVLVLGCGLIGTSVGLALTSGGQHDVALHDEQVEACRVAVLRGAGRRWDGRESARVVLAAVPPAATAAALHRAQSLGLGRTYTHVASVQSQVQREVEALGCDLSRLVGGHPLAGREVSGPEGATSDLFVGRPWALCPSPATLADALEDVRALAEACGAVPLEVDIARHDASVALLSHLPQVAASALAGLLVYKESRADGSGAAPAAGNDVRPAAVTGLSGPGLADTTRLAAGDATLWTQILAANAEHVAPAVRQLGEHLLALAGQLEVLASGHEGSSHQVTGARGTGGATSAGGRATAGETATAGEPATAEATVAARETASAVEAVRTFLLRGNEGRALVPVKRGDVSDVFAPVAVDVDDRPGRLAALLTAAGAAGVNVEDVRVEHVPGRPRGVIELLVAAGTVEELTAALLQGGWDVRGTGARRER